MLNILQLHLVKGTYFEAASGKNIPGGRIIDFVEQSIEALGLPLPLGCCPKNKPTQGQVLSWDVVKQQYIPTTIALSGLGTNLGYIPSSTNGVVTSSTGNSTIITLANSSNAGLISPALFTFLTNTMTSGLFAIESITGNGLIGSPFKLVNDNVTPGVNVYYGTNAAGIKGFFALPSSGGISNLALGTLTTLTVPVTNSSGTGFTIPQATITTAGVVSNTDQIKLNNLSGTNTGDVTVTDSGSIDFTLTGQNITAVIPGITAATVGQLPSKGAGDTIVWTTLSGGTPSNLALGTVTATTQPITNSNGTGLTLPSATSITAGLESAANNTKLSFVTITQAVDLDVVEANVNNLITLTGVAANSTNLGTFTGITIPDNVTDKVALQALETAVELKATDANVVHLAGSETITGIKTFTAQPSGITGSSIINVSGGNISSTNIQSAIYELDAEKHDNFIIQEEGVNLGGTGTTSVINFVGSAVTATRASNTVTITIASGGDTTYSAGNGAIVVASGTGVTFTRTTASVWTFAIPASVILKSFKIYSTSGENPGAGVTLIFNYTSNALTNQNLLTAFPPTLVGWNAQNFSLVQAVTGGTATSAFRPSITSASGGNITIDAVLGSTVSTLETLITGVFA